MSLMARIGVFGNPKKRDYVSRLPVWHSCFIVNQMVEPIIVLSNDSMKTAMQALQNFANTGGHHFSSECGDMHATGSMAEGLYVPMYTTTHDGRRGPLCDVDIMIELKHPIAGYDTETSDLILKDSESDVHPGYALLWRAGSDLYCCNGTLVNRMERELKDKNKEIDQHNGPALKTCEVSNRLKISVDYLYSIKCPAWPKSAKEWIKRSRRSRWPSNEIVAEIVKFGCHLVPVAHPHSKYGNHEFRISFSVAEKKFAHTLTVYQRDCYVHFKSLVKEFTQHIKTYHCKTIMFWVCEDVPQSWWQVDTMFQGVTLLLDKLIHCLVEHKLPNYFISKNNLISSIRRNNTPDKTIGRKDSRDEVKRLLKIRLNPLRHLFKFFDTSSPGYRSILYELYEALMNFVYNSNQLGDLFKSFHRHLGELMMAHLSSQRDHDGQDFMCIRSCIKRLVFMNRTGQDCGYACFKPDTSTDTMEAVMIDTAECYIKNVQDNGFVRIKLAELYHHRGQKISLKMKILEGLNVVAKMFKKYTYAHKKEEIMNLKKALQELSNTNMKKANDNYIKARELLTDWPTCPVQENTTCIIKYANFLYQTGTDLLKASVISRDVLAKPGIDCFISFHKEQNLTVDTNMRLYLDEVPKYLSVPLKALAYYILAMCLIKLDDYKTASTSLATFESEVKSKRILVYYDVPGSNFHVASLVGHIHMALEDYIHAKEAFAFANNQMKFVPSEVNCALIKLCESKLS